MAAPFRPLCSSPGCGFGGRCHPLPGRALYSKCYSDYGKHTNMVESYFSRLRNMVSGQHHHVSPQYLHQYANQAAWQKDNRRTDNGTLAKIVVSSSMGAPVSRAWKGYWQRVA